MSSNIINPIIIPSSGTKSTKSVQPINVISLQSLNKSFASITTHPTLNQQPIIKPLQPSLIQPIKSPPSQVIKPSQPSLIQPIKLPSSQVIKPLQLSLIQPIKSPPSQVIKPSQLSIQPIKSPPNQVIKPLQSSLIQPIKSPPSQVIKPLQLSIQPIKSPPSQVIKPLQPLLIQPIGVTPNQPIKPLSSPLTKPLQPIPSIKSPPSLVIKPLQHFALTQPIRALPVVSPKPPLTEPISINPEISLPTKSVSPIIPSPPKSIVKSIGKVEPKLPDKHDINEILNGIPAINPFRIKAKREYIEDVIVTERFAGNVNPSFINSSDLERLYQLYDKYFFGGILSDLLQSNHSTLNFAFNPRLTRTIGRCSKKRCAYEIDFSWSQIDKISSDPDPRNRQMGGIPCESRIRCLQQVMEHELIHLLLYLQGMFKEHHGPKFRHYLVSFFNQTEINHKHFREDNDDQLTRDEAEVGMRVKLTFKGQVKFGTITKVNPKRAAIEVDDGFTLKGSYSLLTQLFPGDPGYEAPLKPLQAKPSRPKPSGPSKKDFKSGMRVQFTHKGQTFTGIITRINPKRATVVTDENREFLIPYRILTTISSGASLPGPISGGQSRKSGISKSDAYVGMRVRFVYRHKSRIGTVTKLNPKTAGVISDDQEFDGLVSYSFLNPV